MLGHRLGMLFVSSLSSNPYGLGIPLCVLLCRLMTFSRSVMAQRSVGWGLENSEEIQISFFSIVFPCEVSFLGIVLVTLVLLVHKF